MRPYGGPGSIPGSGRGLLYNLCTTITSCFSVFCCCWLIEDCFLGRRTLTGPRYGPLDPPPPDIGPRSHGLLSSIFGGPRLPPPDVGPQPHALLGTVIGGPPNQPGPFGYGAGLWMMLHVCFLFLLVISVHGIRLPHCIAPMQLMPFMQISITTIDEVEHDGSDYIDTNLYING